MATKIASQGTYPGSSGDYIYGTYTPTEGDPVTDYWRGYGPITVSEGTWTLTSVKVDLKRYLIGVESPAAGNVTVEVRTGTIDGSLVATGSVDRTTITAGGAHTFQEFTLSGSVSSDDLVFLIFKDQSGYYDRSPDPDEQDRCYVGANAVTSQPYNQQHNSVSGWTTESTRRWVWELYGTEYIEPPGKARYPTPADEADKVSIRGIDALKYLQWEAPA